MNQKRKSLMNLNHQKISLAFQERLYVKDGNIIGDPSQVVKTRSSYRNICQYVTFLSHLEPKNVKKALKDYHWILAMHEKLNQLEINKVWNLVHMPNNHPTIGIKWIFRNKMDENSNIVRNKVRLVAQGYNQEEGIAYEYAPIAKLEAK